jgi:hypothetical protein
LFNLLIKIRFAGSHNFERNASALEMLESYKTDQQKAAEKAGDWNSFGKEKVANGVKKAHDGINGTVHSNGASYGHSNGVNGVH